MSDTAWAALIMAWVSYLVWLSISPQRRGDWAAGFLVTGLSFGSFWLALAVLRWPA